MTCETMPKCKDGITAHIFDCVAKHTKPTGAIWYK